MRRYLAMRKLRQSHLLTQGVLSGLLVMGILTEGTIWAASPKGNHGQPFAELAAQIGLILDRIDDLGDKIATLSTDLNGITQNWDKKLNSTNGDANGCNSDRFTCIWPTAEFPDGAAVRDNETGLVWDRKPATFSAFWYNAAVDCQNKEVGGRKGFHLPMVEQFASLVDPMQESPALPANHPFVNIFPGGEYFTATTSINSPDLLVSVWFENGEILVFPKDEPGVEKRVWCVRGGRSYDGQDVRKVIDALPR